MNMGAMFAVSRGRCPIPPAARASAPLRTWQGADNFDQPLEWDVASVTYMSSMFSVSLGSRQPVARASAPLRIWQDTERFDQPLQWNVANVRYMANMFTVSPGRRCLIPPLQRAPQHPSASGRMPPASTSRWSGTTRVSRAWAIHVRCKPGRCPIPPAARASASLRTWQRAFRFNQPLEWDVASVTSLGYMFYVSPGRCPVPPAARASAPLRTWQYASDFNQPLEWDIASVASMGNMFHVSPCRCPIARAHSFIPHQHPALPLPRGRTPAR